MLRQIHCADAKMGSSVRVMLQSTTGATPPGLQPSFHITSPVAPLRDPNRVSHNIRCPSPPLFRTDIRRRPSASYDETTQNADESSGSCDGATVSSGGSLTAALNRSADQSQRMADPELVPARLVRAWGGVQQGIGPGRMYPKVSAGAPLSQRASHLFRQETGRPRDWSPGAVFLGIRPRRLRPEPRLPTRSALRVRKDRRSS